MIDLFGGLTGTVTHGGTWYNPSNVALTGSSFQTGTISGQGVYKYVVSNGECDADTASVIINIQNCNFLSIDEAVFENVTLSPNPNNGLFQIAGLPVNEDFDIEITDMNGRFVSKIKTVNNAIANVDLSSVEKGIYLVKISGVDASKTVRVVKQ